MRSKKRGGSSSNKPPSYSNTMSFNVTRGQTNRRITATPTLSKPLTPEEQQQQNKLNNMISQMRFNSLPDLSPPPVRGPRTPSPPPPPSPVGINLTDLSERLEAANIETDEANATQGQLPSYNNATQGQLPSYNNVTQGQTNRRILSTLSGNVTRTSSQPRRRTRQLPPTPSGIVTSASRQPRGRKKLPTTPSGNVTSTPRQPRGRKKLPNRPNKGINMSRNTTQNRSRRNRPIIQRMRNRTVRRAPSYKTIMREKSKKNIVNRRKNSN